MRKQPILNVGIMAEPRIEFVLDSVFHHRTTNLLPGEYTIELKGREMVLQGNGVAIISAEEIVLLPVFHTNSFLLKNVTIGIQFHWEQKENQRFTGGIRFINEEGKVRAVNTVHLEDYLKSVISSEMSAASSPELLKAHAVISRSWLIAQLDKNKRLSITGKSYDANQVLPGEIVRWYDREDHPLFDVCADDHCQRYQGITKIISAWAIDAVEATSGQVLMTGEEVCDARFSKCCGGISESFENVWEPESKPYLTAIADRTPLGSLPFTDLRGEEKSIRWIMTSPDAFCNTSNQVVLSQVLPDFDRETKDFFRWKMEYARDEIAALIKDRSGLDFGFILRLEPLQRGFSGRINRLRIIGTLRTMIVGKELEIRKWLSPSHLYSSAFTVDYEEVQDGIPGRIILHGAGWGHGVGLCQIGAAVMGEMGYNYHEILDHYFKNTAIHKLYEV